jgi:hypothetical protein
MRSKTFVNFPGTARFKSRYRDNPRRVVRPVVAVHLEGSSRLSWMRLNLLVNDAGSRNNDSSSSRDGSLVPTRVQDGLR